MIVPQGPFVCNLDAVKKFLKRVVQYNMKTLLQVPAVYHDVCKDTWEDRWDMTNPDREIVDLTAHWGKVTLDQCSKWQRDFTGYSDDADRVSSIWGIKELIMNLLDPKLKKKVNKIYSKLEGYQQGGITFFKITMDTVFKMSIMAEKSFKSFIKDFGKNGLAKIPRENVRLISGQINGVA